MSVFEVERKSFENDKHFHRYLSENYEALIEDKLYVISGITELSFDNFIQTLREQGWRVIESYDAVKKIGQNYAEGYQAEAYLTFNKEKNLFFLYTDQRKTEEIDGAIKPLINKTPGIHYLYISPTILREIREQIAGEIEAAQVTEFVAKRTAGTEIPAEKRGDQRRTINYYGEDGLETMREMEKKYGVLPHIMQIKAPNGLKFRVNKRGMFRLQSGPLMDLYKYMEKCIEQCTQIKRAYDHTDYDTMETASGVEIPLSEPAAIRLQTLLGEEDIQRMKNSLRKRGFVLYDDYSGRESLFLSGKVYDEENNIFFNIRVQGKEVRLFPDEDTDISAFFRFFEFIQSNIDEKASPKPIEA